MCKSFKRSWTALLYFFILYFILLLPSFVYASIESSGIGNFALPGSQQPGPLVGFGQRLIDAKESQVFLLGARTVGVDQYSNDLIASTIYGVTDDLSLSLDLPYALHQKDGTDSSSGIRDIYAEVDYAFYNFANSHYVDQAIINGAVTLPSGSGSKSPSTGVGSEGYFLGFTYNRTYVDWVLFAAPGAYFPTARNGTHFGNTYFYQLGVGKNVVNLNGWILAWVAELTGNYSQKDRVSGVINADSGGNIIYLTPSLWASTRHLTLQLGVGTPVTQHLFGDQARQQYRVLGNVGWSFYG